VYPRCHFDIVSKKLGRQEWKQIGIEIVVAEVHKAVKDIGLRSSLSRWAGQGLAFDTVDAAVEDFLARHPQQPG